MNIFIIGNGFDLAHGLKTRYSDFLLDAEINNIWFEHLKYKYHKNGNTTWIDFETEIYNVLKSINWKTNHIPSMKHYPATIRSILEYKKIFDEDYKKLDDNQKNYIKFNGDFKYGDLIFELIENIDLINFLYNELIELSVTFKEYCIKIDKIKIEFDKIVLEPFYNFRKLNLKYADNINILNFNYTNTFERLYKNDFNSINSVHIHGNCKEEHIIFGTQSFNRKINENGDIIGKDKDFPSDLNIFEKYTLRHKFRTIDKFQKLLREMYYMSTAEKAKSKIYIIGHSLNKTDHGILKSVFDNSGQCDINVYYHNEEAQEQYIRNMRDIIGEDAVTRRVCFTNTSEIMA
ncbi:MAG: bacteriophage abortive infection AbiH family protein [Oscillospiraceae bacterium]|jgi:hypothetical protein|nr:bacteriophage abortive infection AbiH family protein [Oscillospiraceae bacterium]